MPGRKETAVHSLFDVRESEVYKGKRAFCKFCFNDVANNGTRKTQHILNCMHCSEEIKRKFLGCDTQTTAKSHKRKQKDPKMEAKQKMKGKHKLAKKMNSPVNATVLTDASDEDEPEGYEEAPKETTKNSEPEEDFHTQDQSLIKQSNLEETRSSEASEVVESSPSESVTQKKPLAPIFTPGFSGTKSKAKTREQITPVKTKMQKSQTPLLVDRMSTFQNVSIVYELFNDFIISIKYCFCAYCTVYCDTSF